MNKTIRYKLTASTFSWEIGPGKTIQAWGYNEQVPGPVLRGQAGDTLEIEVTNRLSEPTSVHWHGLRLPAPMDGTEFAQQPIVPGETFTYRFVLPDAGTFWYHSHINEPHQMERGLYGSLVVTGSDEPILDDDKVFIIDDMKLDRHNAFIEPSWFIPRFIEHHDGRQGNTVLVNGKEVPTIVIPAGTTERWRFINASSARYILLSLGGRPFRILATDGGLLEHPETVTKLLITPGERYDIAGGPFEENDSFMIESLSYNRMTIQRSERTCLANVEVGTARISQARIPEQIRVIEPVVATDSPVTRNIRLAVGFNLKNGLSFLINGLKHGNDPPVTAGEIQVWELQNLSLMDHPFHLHGAFFQILSINGDPPAYRAWKDTVNLPPRSSVRIAWIPENNPGTWMYHCHILEHHESGMMANFEVLPSGTATNERALSISAQRTHHH